jgi:hypothetical protein
MTNCAGALELPQGRLDVILSKISQHDLHAGLDEGVSHAKTDATGATGDKCSFAREDLHPRIIAGIARTGYNPQPILIPGGGMHDVGSTERHGAHGN